MLKLTRLRSHTALVGAVVLAAALTPGVATAEDWLDSIQDQRCLPEDIDLISGNARNAIEAAVRRAEMAIQAPTPVGDLGCLNDLMTAGLDTFSNVGGLLGTLQGGLGNISGPSLNIDMDVSGMICGFAAEKFATLTEPLSSLDKNISEFASMASSASDRVNGTLNAAFTDIAGGSWSSGNVTSTTASGNGYGGFSGAASTTDSSGYSGSISSYVVPDTSASPSDVTPATYTATPAIIPDNGSSDDWADYNQRMMIAMGQYIGCRVAGELDGTEYSTNRYWDVPGTLSSCTFPNMSWPSYMSAERPTTLIQGDGDAQSAPEVDRSGGQSRPDPEVFAPVEDTSKPSNATIWEMLGQ